MQAPGVRRILFRRMSQGRHEPCVRTGLPLAIQFETAPVAHVRDTSIAQPKQERTLERIADRDGRIASSSREMCRCIHGHGFSEKRMWDRFRGLKRTALDDVSDAEPRLQHRSRVARADDGHGTDRLAGMKPAHEGPAREQPAHAPGEAQRDAHAEPVGDRDDDQGEGLKKILQQGRLERPVSPHRRNRGQDARGNPQEESRANKDTAPAKTESPGGGGEEIPARDFKSEDGQNIQCRG
ncbi:MAG: hypothetical protein BWY66_02065 [bacterium ADurb.Bin374]|nr:MAG: hypothetical protein BWY66_02065 [bacterium ADurb.Bin374]